MPEPTPEAWAQIRQAYEHTDKPLAHICAEHDISIPTLRYRMKVWQWRRRKPLIPREGPPPVLPLVIPGRDPQAANPDSISPALRRIDSGPAAFAASRNDDVFAAAQTVDPPPPEPAPARAQAQPGWEGEAAADPATIVRRLRSAVARVLPAIEAIIARLAGDAGPREMEQAGRTLSSLTRTLRELNALLAQHNAGAAADDDFPEDIDAIRLELARRIDAFITSRTTEEHLT